MFSTIEVGKKIASLRKEKDLTQMELADSMGVSYQAVSNWERGNSMPDISKFPELVKILGCSIDELLGNKEESKFFQRVIEGNVTDYIKEEKVSVEEVASAAPMLKPRQTENLLETILEENKEHITLKDLVRIAPFVKEDFLLQWIDKMELIENLSGVIPLAPFLSSNSLDMLVNKISEIGSLSHITGLAPFLSEKTLDSLVDKAMEEGSIKDCVGLYPFLSRDTSKRLAEKLMKENNIKEFIELAPFL